METRDELSKLSALQQKLLEEGRQRTQKDEHCGSGTNVQQHEFVVKSNPKQNYKGNKNGKKPKTFKSKFFACGEVGRYANQSSKKSQVKSSAESAADSKMFNKGK